METTEKIIFVLFIVLMVPFSAGLYFLMSQNKIVDVSGGINTASVSSAVLSSAGQMQNNNQVVAVPRLENPPQILKAVYLTGWSAGSKKYVDNYLENIFKTTQVNAVVVDIKDYSGFVLYNSESPMVKEYKLWKNSIPNINELVEKLHSKGIYVIARITVFQDPVLSLARPDLAIYNKAETTDIKNPVLWKDNGGLYWLDPASQEVSDYIISIAKDAVSHGFDEINFDYVRFPSDGKLSNMGFPIWNGKTLKKDVIKDFSKKLREELKDVKISLDIFGQTTTDKGDMGIGQVIENSFEYFDYVYPMIYPSHYADGFLGFDNPAEHPYEIIKYSLKTALQREKSFYIEQLQNVVNQKNSDKSTNDNTENALNDTGVILTSKIRPWLQDFNMGAIYTKEMVLAEIKASQDSLGQDYSGFLLWNSSNIYTKEAMMEINNE